MPQRYTRLTEPLSEGPGESWINPTVDLVNGESMTQLERLFAVADCANGTGSKLDAFIQAMEPGVILETVRTGASGIGRGERILRV